MVCKEDFVTWFKELTSYNRIDVMCTLQNMCLPLELRFLGTCLEDLGKRDFLDLRDAENRANNSTELSDFQCLSDKRTQRKLSLYLSLLRSCNYACSNGLYKVLANFNFAGINAIISNSPDENPFEELLLVYTLALNHPAFTYEQKSVVGNILLKLQEEENKMYSAKHTLDIDLVYTIKSPMQPCIPCPSSEERSRQDAGAGPHCPGLPQPSSHTTGVDLKGRNTLPPGLALPPGLGLPPEQLTGTSYMHLTFPASGHPSLPSMPWHGGMSPLVMAEICGALPAEGGEASPYPSSPLMSRQSSPSQSGSPSRAGSPSRLPPDRGQAFTKAPPPNRRQERRQNCVDTSVAPPATLHPQKNPLKKPSTEPLLDPLRETLGKEMPNYLTNLQNYSIDELRCMCDENLKELGLPVGAIHQLRSIVTKLQATNGLSSLEKREPSRRKPEPTDIDQAAERKSQSGGPMMRRYSGLPMDAPIMFPPPPMMNAGTTGPCFTCIAVPVSTGGPARFQGQQMYHMNNNLHSLRLDSNSSSASDSSSTSHSPPDTPHWDRGYTTKDPNGGERWSPGCEDKDRRFPEPCEKPPVEESLPHQQPPLPHNNRPRVLGGLGRGKTNPPGLQTLPRGRGPHPSTMNVDKSLPGCRREAAVNGTRTSHLPSHGVSPDVVHGNVTYTAVTSASQPPPPQYSVASNQPLRPGESNVPYSHAPAFLPHYPALRTSGSIIPNFPPGSFFRPTFPFSPNGELVYPYHGPQTPPPPPVAAYLPLPYSAIPPPKLSCYNCGSQSHHANDCKDPTMEEVTKPGQYRLDYAPYQKPGECLSEK